jgi:hypothetical protein
LVVVCYNGSIEEGERVLSPLRAFGDPLADGIGPISYVEFQNIYEAAFPPGIQNYWKSNILKALDEEAIDVVIDHVSRIASPQSAVLIEHIGGAVKRVGNNETAFNHRDANYSLLVCGMCGDPAETEKNVRWAQGLWEAMQPFSSGAVCVNYMGQESDEGGDRVRAAYGPEKRLAMLANA